MTAVRTQDDRAISQRLGKTPLFPASPCCGKDFSKEKPEFRKDFRAAPGRGSAHAMFAIRGEPDDFLPSIQSDFRTSLFRLVTLGFRIRLWSAIAPGQIQSEGSHNRGPHHDQRSRSLRLYARYRYDRHTHRPKTRRRTASAPCRKETPFQLPERSCHT